MAMESGFMVSGLAGSGAATPRPEGARSGYPHPVRLAPPIGPPRGVRGNEHHAPMMDETTREERARASPASTRSRAESLVPWLAGLLLAAPVLVAYYPPMTDLAFHEAAIGLLRHRNDPTRVPPGLYLLSLGEPNQLFYLLG